MLAMQKGHYKGYCQVAWGKAGCSLSDWNKKGTRRMLVTMGLEERAVATKPGILQVHIM